jgi:hypothetical protein
MLTLSGSAIRASDIRRRERRLGVAYVIAALLYVLFLSEFTRVWRRVTPAN